MAKNVTIALPIDLYRAALAFARTKVVSLNAMIRELLLRETKPSDFA